MCFCICPYLLYLCCFAAGKFATYTDKGDHDWATWDYIIRGRKLYQQASKVVELPRCERRHLYPRTCHCRISIANTFLFELSISYLVRNSLDQLLVVSCNTQITTLIRFQFNIYLYSVLVIVNSTSTIIKFRSRLNHYLVLEPDTIAFFKSKSVSSWKESVPLSSRPMYCSLVTIQLESHPFIQKIHPRVNQLII